MNSVKVLIVLVVLAVIGRPTLAKESASGAGKALLTVDFQQNQTLKYRFLSSRDITMDWGQQGSSGKNKVDKLSESLELIVSYTPFELDPYGLTTIKAVCESAKVTRVGQSSRQITRPDAAESFTGKTWTFTVDPRGKIYDRSKLYNVIRQAGEAAFRPDRSHGAVKEPDMIYDFIASQWFLWDSISNIPNPAEGVNAGEQWQSKLFVPAPMILFAARDVNYRLEQIRREPNDRIAVIDSSYSLLYPNPPDWPVPYTERFQMVGMFGLLHEYKTLDLQGQGQELFDIDAGRTEKYTQKYTMHVQANLPMLPGVNPMITIDQTMTMEFLKPKVSAQPNLPQSQPKAKDKSKSKKLR